MNTTMNKPFFSLSTYLFVVFAISWPFQFFIYWFPGADWAMKMLLVSMVMVTVGTVVCSKLIFRDTFGSAGWSWGKPKHYVYAILFPLVVWALPTVLGLSFGMQILPSTFSLSNALMVFAVSFLITLIPAFGEEFGWRGYLLPRLLKTNSIRNALLIQAVIWWAWHLPVLVYSGLYQPVVAGNPILSVAIVLVVSIAPSMMHAIIFAYFWSQSASLGVVTVYHSAFDEVRDTIEDSFGFGLLVQIWQMIVITFVGLWLLYKGKWGHLKELQLDQKDNNG